MNKSMLNIKLTDIQSIDATLLECECGFKNHNNILKICPWCGKDLNLFHAEFVNESVKDRLLKYINNPPIETKALNRMGCSENWYSPLYAMTHTFTREEIVNMSEETVAACLKLAGTISDYLY